MPYTDCIDCGEEFWREDDEFWKKRCYDCWRESKGLNLPYTARQTELQKLQEEIRQLRWENDRLQQFENDLRFLFKYAGFLIFACHPDRVPGREEAAHEVLVWLNRKREQFREAD